MRSVEKKSSGFFKPLDLRRLQTKLSAVGELITDMSAVTALVCYPA